MRLVLEKLESLNEQAGRVYGVLVPTSRLGDVGPKVVWFASKKAYPKSPEPSPEDDQDEYWKLEDILSRVGRVRGLKLKIDMFMNSMEHGTKVRVDGGTMFGSYTFAEAKEMLTEYEEAADLVTHGDV